MQRMVGPWQHGFMKTSAARSHGTRRLGPALALVALLAFGAFGAAGELAVLHRVLAADRPSGQAEPTAPCDAQAGVRCLPRPGAAADAPPTASRIGIETTDCRLGCEAFTAIFAPDGSFTYHGEANVERLGDHTGRVDATALRHVMRLADEAGFERLDDTYPSPFLDGQSTYVMVEWARQTKVVMAAAGAEPATFWALKTLLLDLLASAEWDE